MPSSFLNTLIFNTTQKPDLTSAKDTAKVKEIFILYCYMIQKTTKCHSQLKATQWGKLGTKTLTWNMELLTVSTHLQKESVSELNQTGWRHLIHIMTAIYTVITVTLCCLGQCLINTDSVRQNGDTFLRSGQRQRSHFKIKTAFLRLLTHRDAAQ